METYKTLVDAANNLISRGYTASLSIEGEAITDKEKSILMFADDFEIDEFYHFGGIGEPVGIAVIYAVSSTKYNLKGVLISTA